MKRLPILLLVFVASVATAEIPEFLLGESQQVENITIWPVLSQGQVPRGSYITLDEGLKLGTVTVSEIGASLENAEGDESRVINVEPVINQETTQQIQQSIVAIGGGRVNTLHITNQSDRHLFLMAGEIIFGGKQNRVVSHDLILPPSPNPVDIAVFCVEQGRWTPLDGGEQSQYFTSGKTMVAQSSLRKTVVTSSDQQSVWSKVEEINENQAATTSTSDYTSNLSDTEINLRVDTLVAALSDGVSDASAVGYVVAINGEIVGCDLFWDDGLFESLSEKVLRVYCLDAVFAAKAAPIDLTTGTPSAETFLKTVVSQNTTSSEKTTENYRYYTLSGDGVSGSYINDVTDQSNDFADTYDRLHQVWFITDIE